MFLSCSVHAEHAFSKHAGHGLLADRILQDGNRGNRTLRCVHGGAAEGTLALGDHNTIIALVQSHNFLLNVRMQPRKEISHGARTSSIACDKSLRSILCESTSELNHATVIVQTYFVTLPP